MAFFHANVKSKRRRNKLTSLQTESRKWCESEEEEISKYFNKLFTGTRPKEFNTIRDEIPQTITREMNLKLSRPISELEKKMSCFLMNPNKDPGTDGMTLFFFQRFATLLKLM